MLIVSLQGFCPLAQVTVQTNTVLPQLGQLRVLPGGGKRTERDLSDLMNWSVARTVLHMSQLLVSKNGHNLSSLGVFHFCIMLILKMKWHAKQIVIHIENAR